MNPVLHAQSSGSGAQTLVLLHGLLGLGSNLGAIARAFAPDVRVIAPDLRNHGRSFRAPGMSYREMAADLARTLDVAAVGQVSLLGHSMGGKLAMQFALDFPSRCERLLVADISPVEYAPHHGPVFDALLAVDACPEADRRETARMLGDRLEDQALVSLLLMHRERVPEGNWAWRLGLRHIVEGYPAILAAPETSAEGSSWSGPALFLRGELSDYVLPDHHALISALFPGSRTETIAGAGHWLHAQRPDVFITRAREFLLG
jgi:esterase